MPYNGWTNYETWAAHLWLTNDEATYNSVRRLIRAAKDDVAAYDVVKEYITDGAPETFGLYSDLLGAAMQAIDYRAIVKAFKENDDAPVV